MATHDYSESQLVEQPAMDLLAELGWTVVNASNETLGELGTVGRDTKREVVLTSRLRSALIKLNPKLSATAIESAIDELTRDRTGMGAVGANREVYGLLKDGIVVSLADPVNGGQKQERVRVVDWNDPAQNDFIAVTQLKIQGPMYACIPDLIGFINGLPLVVMEFKKPGVDDRVAFDENLTSYKHFQNGVPALFAYNALLITSNGTESHVGSLTADWERFFEWKRIERENEERRVSLEVVLRGTCTQHRLLDIVENFTLFSELSEGTAKIVGQNHQFLGVNNAILASLEAREKMTGQGGVFWHTQGSGKSFSMVFFAQKIMRKVPGNWTFVVITDRVELDDQIAKTFKACGAVSDSESKECHATSGAHLADLLTGNHRYVFTLIHKFQSSEPLCDRRDVIVLVDEAHRSQYDTMAMNMRAALPNATFVAFTGTPLIASDERTKEIFGDYVSIYDFQMSVEDKATVPLYYENRTPELQLVNPNLNDDIYDVVEAAGLNEEAEDRLEKLLGKQYHLITRDDRLETVAKDIVEHFTGRGFQGKAMVVSIDKATALRMYNKVQRHWAQELNRVEQLLANPRTTDTNRADLIGRRDSLRNTEMALIVSPGQNEIEEMKAKGLDIVPHRELMNKGGLDERFKKPSDPLSLVFVCAMWLTGFDAPSCSTVYLDKPMRNHTLMQTIARANRVYPGKQSGVIVDYANVFLSLEKALAIYGKGTAGVTPVHGKAELAEELASAVRDVSDFCKENGADLKQIETHRTGSMERLTAVANAVEALISPDPRRKQFLAHVRLVDTLYKAVKPHPSAIKFASRVSALAVISDEIRRKLHPNPINLDNVLAAIDKVLDDSIVGAPTISRETNQIDLSKIDFEALKSKFKQSEKKQTEIEELKAAIRAQLDKLILLNKTRIDFLEKFEALIEAYNSGAANIDSLFTELVNLAQGLSDEQQRHLREQMTEEELVIFDILTRPAPDLSPEETNEIKKVAREMLARLKDLLVVDWRSKRGAVSKVKLTIDEQLDAGLPEKYDADLYKNKCSAVFEHVYEKYAQKGASVYSQAS